MGVGRLQAHPEEGPVNRVPLSTWRGAVSAELSASIDSLPTAPRILQRRTPGGRAHGPVA